MKAIKSKVGKDAMIINYTFLVANKLIGQK